MSSIAARKRNNYWEYRFDGPTISGKRKQYSKSGFVRKSDALKAGNDAYNELFKTGVYFKQTNMSFADLVEKYKKEYLTTLKASTGEGYMKHIRNNILPNLGHYSIAAVDAAKVENILFAMHDRGISDNSINECYCIISTIFNFAIKNGLAQSNPTELARKKFTKMPSKPKNKIERYVITPETFAKITERFPFGTSCYLPLMFGYLCGMRQGEAFAITWDDVDFEKQEVTINRQMTHEGQNIVLAPPKYDSYRTIKLSSQLLNALKQTKENQDEIRKSNNPELQHYYINVIDEKRLHGKLTPFQGINTKEIFFVNVGEILDVIQDRRTMHLGRIVHHELGIKEYNFHSLRHSHATLLLENGANIKDVQHRLGHKNIKETLEIYTHLTKTMEETSVKILDKIAV